MCQYICAYKNILRLCMGESMITVCLWMLISVSFKCAPGKMCMRVNIRYAQIKLCVFYFCELFADFLERTNHLSRNMCDE